MTKQKIKRDFETDWFPHVDKMLRSLGYKHTELCKKSWQQSYDDGLSPFQAVNDSEFDGNLTWKQFQKLKRATKGGTE